MNDNGMTIVVNKLDGCAEVNNWMSALHQNIFYDWVMLVYELLNFFQQYEEGSDHWTRCRRVLQNRNTIWHVPGNATAYIYIFLSSDMLCDWIFLFEASDHICSKREWQSDDQYLMTSYKNNVYMRPIMVMLSWLINHLMCPETK
jgi:hypothetical protein